MNKLHFSGSLVAACLSGVLLAVGVSASAVAAPTASASSVYSQLSGDFHAMLTTPSSQIKADQIRFQKTTGPCLTRALTALTVAQSSGGADASAAKAANRPLLYEAAFQMIMQSSKPIINQYLRALKLAVSISGVSGADKVKVVSLAKVFSRAQNLRTCADATAWAASDYSAASEPQGVKLIADLEQVEAGSFPSSSKFDGFTATQTSALTKIVKLASKRFQAVIKQIENRGAPWLSVVLVHAVADAQKQTTTTTTTTTPTTTTPTSTTTTPSTTTT
jgi:hypothetical protein